MTEGRNSFDLHHHWNAIRDRAGVWRDDTRRGTLNVAAYEQVRQVLSNPSLSRSPTDANESSTVFQLLAALLEGRRAPDGAVGFDPRTMLIFLEGEDHQRVRSFLEPALRRRIAGAGPLAKRIAENAASALPPSGENDLVKDFAQKIPVALIAEIVGIEHDPLALFRAAEGTMRLFDELSSPQEREAALASFELLAGVVRTAVRDHDPEAPRGLLGDLLDRSSDGLPMHEIVVQAVGLLVAGTLTSTDLIGSTLYYLLSTPALASGHLESADQLAALVDEVLRLEPPSTFTYRVCPQEGKIGSCSYTRGDTIVALVSAANRDPEVFADPDALTLGATRSSHLTFGGGQYFCPGAPLARLEAVAAARALMSRISRLELLDDEPDWCPPLLRRGLNSLRVIPRCPGMEDV